jgi:hypothetical protein
MTGETDGLRTVLQESADQFAERMIAEIRTRFAEVNERLDRIDRTLTSHGQRIAEMTRVLTEAVPLDGLFRELE